MNTTLSSPTTRRVLLWVGALSLVVRLLYFSEHSRSPFFAVPLLDGKYYDTVARGLLEGRDLKAINPGFRPFLYPAFLAVIYQVAGSWGPVLALAVQHLLGVVTTLLVAWLALRLYRRAAAGVLAGGLYAVAGPPLYFEGELLITTLYSVLALVPLVVLAGGDNEAQNPGAADQAVAPLRWFLAAAVVGLAIQARPNLVLFLAAFPLAAMLWRRGGGRRVVQATLAAFAGAAAVLVLAALCSWPLWGRWQLWPSSGGVNLYLGNKVGADGMIPRQDRAVTYGDEYRDSVQVFASETMMQATGVSSPSPAAVSRFWVGRTVAEVRRDPRHWLELMGRKVVFLAWNREIPNNTNFAFAQQEESLILRWLPVRWWLLLAFAPLGTWFAWRRGDPRVLFWILAFLGTSSVSIVLFFVNGRYRAPLWPTMAVLAAGGFLAMAAAMRQRNLRALAAHLAVVSLLAVGSLVNWFGIPQPDFARDYFFRSLAQLEKGDVEGAAADARRSVDLDPTDPAAQCQLGNLAMELGDLNTAYSSYRAAAELAPREPRVYNNLAILHERTGRPGDAYRGYLFALLLAEDYAPALVNAALLELRAGMLPQAAAHVEKAQALGFDSVTLECARAFLDGASGRVEEARQRLSTARRRDPQTVDRLVEDHRRRLSPEELAAGLPQPAS